MRRVAVIGAVAALAATATALGTGARVALPRTSAGTAGCGFERWPVKTLADALGRRLALSPVHSTTIPALAALPVAQGGQATRGAGAERRVYRVRALLTAASVEADSDVHLALADPFTGRTMIAEIPAPACTRGATPADRALMTHARAAFVRACGDPGAGGFTVYAAMTAVTVTGVGFFDFKHHQRGVAAKGIELHPVIRFSAPHCIRA
jgi:hypothetical protein